MTYSDEEQSPFTERKFIVAAVVVAAIVVMAVVVILMNRGNGGSTAAESSPSVVNTQPSSASPGPSESADPAASACGLPAGDQTVPTTPPEARWELVGTMAMPTAEDVGPGVTSSGGIHSCYAHSPTGALFAAVAGIADFAAVDDTVALLTERVLPGPARDAAIADLKQAQNGSDSDMPDGYGGEVTAQVAGFQITASSQDTVSLTLVLRYSDGQLQGRQATMQWYEGDWRMVGGDVTPFVVSSLAGYVPWAGA